MGRIIHGNSPFSGPTPEYRAYYAMRNRCLNPNQARYADYGARGITICDRWLTGDGHLSGFACFLADMGPKPAGRTLDRRNNDLGYTPDNCRWATREEQGRNTRANRIINIAGVDMVFVEAASRWGAVSVATARTRLHRGWSPEGAIFTPPGRAEGSFGIPVCF